MILRSLAAPNHGFRPTLVFLEFSECPLPPQIAGFCVSAQAVGVASTCRLRP